MANSITDEAEFIRMRVALATVFSPSGPVDSRDVFAGRIEQIADVMSAVSQRGQHVVLFGERGVGKTSLASLVHEFWADFAKTGTEVFASRENCDPDTTFVSIWAGIAEQIGDTYEKNGETPPMGESWSEMLTRIKDGEASPANVRRLLSLSDRTQIIVVDEFDQITDPGTPPLFASTIKALSDHLINATLVLVGVADTIDDLISEHASIDRAIIQVRMPVMTLDELGIIFRRGFETVGLRASDFLIERMSRLAQGLPHYAHRFGQEAGTAAIMRSSYEIDAVDVEIAIKRAIELTEEGIRLAYHAATTSNRRDALFEQVLLACALTAPDDLGFFSAGDIRNPLETIVGRRYEIPQYTNHLHRFTLGTKTPVLQVIGQQWSRRYRFTSPLLRPYAILRGIERGLVTEDIVRRFDIHGSSRPNTSGEQRRLL